MATMTCVLTGIDVEFEDSSDSIYYTLEFGENKVEVFICRSCKNKIKSNHPYHIVKGLIANRIWPQRSFIVSEQCNNPAVPIDSEMVILPEFFKTLPYPKNPSEKMDHLFLNLIQKQTTDGEKMMIFPEEDSFVVKNYFINGRECLFYVEGLEERELINFKPVGGIAGECSITHKGLNEAIKLTQDGLHSNTCFIAMAFTDDMKPFRQAIKKALDKTGFKPMIIDEEHLESDKTIPDGILAGIKKSKFCVADFTHHRNGVYFESGYAVGLGKPVIYTCRRDEFDNAHFDIKQLQHIIYETEEELENKLSAKIEAWIK